MVSKVRIILRIKIKSTIIFLFELTIILEGLKDIVIPIKYNLINAQTPDIFYDLDQESLDLVSNLRKFLRDKI